MALLKTLKPIKVSGVTVSTGDVISVSNADHLLRMGYVRHLTVDETREIISKYVNESQTLFQVDVKKPEKICFACGGKDFWTSIYGLTICRVCHPPAAPELETKQTIKNKEDINELQTGKWD